MNRVVTILLSVLIALAAANAVLVWNVGRQAHDDATEQSCIEKTNATAMIGIFIPSVITPSDQLDRDAQTQNLGSLSAQLDAC